MEVVQVRTSAINCLRAGLGLDVKPVINCSVIYKKYFTKIARQQN